MKKALFVLALGVILLPLTSDARQKGGPRAALTTLDIIENQQLAIRYSYGLDTGADNGYLYADVFTPDGEFVGRQVPLTQGREALARVARIVISLVGLTATHGQESARGRTAGVLSPQDHLDIQQLVARYAFALDSGADDGKAYADLFTNDGEFIVPSGPIKGREALAAFGRSGFVNGHKPAHVDTTKTSM